MDTRFARGNYSCYREMKYISTKQEGLQNLAMDFSLVSSNDHPGAQRVGEAKDVANYLPPV